MFCKQKEDVFIDNKIIAQAVDSLKEINKKDFPDLETRVQQVAAFWKQEDGTKEEFVNFCINNFISHENEKDTILLKISRNWEILNGNFNKVSLDLKEPVHLKGGKIFAIDQMFAGYEPSSHLGEDLFKNKIAFFLLLNYKYYSLREKNELGINWSRKQWAIARIAEISKSRVPADILLKYNDVVNRSDSYISEYNIFMGNLVNEREKNFFLKV